MKGGSSVFVGDKMVIIPDYVSTITPMIGLAPFIRPSSIITPSIITPGSVIKSGSIITPTPSNGFLKARQYFNPNDDPELHKSVIQYFYKKLTDVWLTTSMEKLLRFIKVEGGNAFIVRDYNEYEKNSDRGNQEKKISYITERIFSKYDLEALLEQLSAEYLLNWYDMKHTHSDFIKRSIYKKLKHRLSRHF